MSRIKSRKPIKKCSATTRPVKDKKPSQQPEKHQSISRNLTPQPRIEHRDRKLEIALEAEARADRMFDKLDPRVMDKVMEVQAQVDRILYYDRLLKGKMP